jgi:NADH-quinone oxidoreductase subunit M
VTIHLSILVFLPLAGAVAALVAGRLGGLAGAVLTLAYSIVALVEFQTAAGGLQFVTSEPWIDMLGITYKLGLDGLNLFLVLLTTVLWTATALWAALGRWGRDRPRLFFFHLGLAETAVLGALLAQDLALFVLFFDLMLVPFIFLTLGWGGERRGPAITKLIIYTLVGSLLMLTAAVATGVLAANRSGGGLTFELSELAGRRLSEGDQQWIFLFFAAAFLVKMPAFPLHGWLTDGYRNMPLPVLAVFSGVLSKVAAYGFLRIVLPLFPDATVHFQELMLLVALASILYGSVIAFTTTDARLVLGYSSVAQLGFITLGIFALRDVGAQGAVLQAVNHGLVVAPALFIVAALAERTGGSEDIRQMGGIALRAPLLAAMFLLVAFATLAMPGSPNFVGEFLILLGVFQSKIVFAFVASAGVVLASVYALRLFIRAMHNRRPATAETYDLRVGDGLVVVPLVTVIVALGLYPQIALERGEATVRAVVAPARELAEAGERAEAEARAQAGEPAVPNLARKPGGEEDRE